MKTYETDKTIFVTGGTGKQGGAVARYLLQEGFTVKVLTRNPNSSNARKLKEPNIQWVKGDLNNTSSYREHLKGAYGIFSVQTFVNGVEKEIRQGVSLATLAKGAGIKHFLYSSAAGANLNSGIAHIDSKFQIENDIRQAGLPFTIIRPASLYENFLVPQVKNGILKGKLVQPIKRDTIQQYIAVEDIGKAAATIFQNTEMYLGRTILLAREQLSAQQVADTFSAALGKPIEYKKLPALIARLFLPGSVYKMFKWIDEKNRFLSEDVDLNRKEFGNGLSLESWIKLKFVQS